MRSMAGWIGVLCLVAGCSVPGDVAKTCTSDADCGAQGTCDVKVGLCYAAGTEPELDPSACKPICAEYQACTRNGCNPRFMALTILSPAPNALLGAAPVQVSAQLVVNPAYKNTTQLPDTLVFGATRAGGGDVGFFGPVTRNGDTYTATWTPPNAQAPITLTASHPTPAAVQSATENVQVDTVPPAFTITFSPPPTRSQGSATQADERDPSPLYGAAFRRDESVTVAISANEPVSNVTLTVVGIGPGGTAGQAQAPIPVQPGGTCDGNPAFCGNVTVDLSTLDMRDIHGTADFQVAGVDAAGNHGTIRRGLIMTRWKWSFDAGGAIVGSPAVGARGFSYLGTNLSNNTGRMLAVGPDGAKKWEFITPSDALGSPAVGAFNANANEEYVYAALRNASGTFLYALRGSDGTEKAKCQVASVTDLPGSLAVGMTSVTVGTAETGTGVFSGTQVHLIGIRPDATLSTDKCVDIFGSGSGALPASVSGGAFVMKDQNIFYGTPTPKLASYDISTGTSTPRTGWPVNTNSFARGLALLGDQVYGAASNTDDPSLGSLFSVPVTSPTGISFVYPQANTSRVFNLAIGGGNTAYFGAETASSAKFESLLLGTSGPPQMEATDVGTLRGAPVVAKNDRLYTLNTAGKLSAWSASSMNLVWSADLALDLNKDTSPTLDCRRDASGTAITGSSLGSLYFASGNKLYAIIVDSPGMDPSAPWPKFQHDARNTGNPATPITTCP